jgi:hypothetical protein
LEDIDDNRGYKDKMSDGVTVVENIKILDYCKNEVAQEKPSLNFI